MKYLVATVYWTGLINESPSIHLPPEEQTEEEFYNTMFDTIYQLREGSAPPKEDIYKRMRKLLEKGHTIMVGNKTFEIQK